MQHITAYRNCKKIILIFFLFSVIFHGQILGQATAEKTNAYGKASYDAERPGIFMKTWLLSGPVSVSADTIAPDDALQEKVFKEDNLSLVNIVAGRPLANVSKGKNLKWEP
ncbi:MAG: hypothetical protein ABIO81_10100, partial [Ginsengibacter sp.]